MHGGTAHDHVQEFLAEAQIAFQQFICENAYHCAGALDVSARTQITRFDDLCQPQNDLLLHGRNLRRLGGHICRQLPIVIFKQFQCFIMLGFVPEFNNITDHLVIVILQCMDHAVILPSIQRERMDFFVFMFMAVPGVCLCELLHNTYHILLESFRYCARWLPNSILPHFREKLFRAGVAAHILPPQPKGYETDFLQLLMDNALIFFYREQVGLVGLQKGNANQYHIQQRHNFRFPMPPHIRQWQTKKKAS